MEWTWRRDATFPLKMRFDEEPILAGNTWGDATKDVAVFNDTDDDDDDDVEDEEEQKETKSSDVIGFHDDF